MRSSRSKVVLIENEKRCYISPANKFVVNLASTGMAEMTDEAAGSAEASAVQPAPTTTILQCEGLGESQAFDVTGLIQEVGEPRDVKNDRVSIALKIHDGTVNASTGGVKLMPLVLYYDKDKDDWSNVRKLLADLMEKHQAATFLNIVGGRDNTGNDIYSRDQR